MTESLQNKEKMELIENRLDELEAILAMNQNTIRKLKKIFINGMQFNCFDCAPFFKKQYFEESRLSRSEAKIAELVIAGKTSKEIGNNLRISDKTVETHRRNIRKKLGIKDTKIELRSYLLAL